MNQQANKKSHFKKSKHKSFSKNHKKNSKVEEEKKGTYHVMFFDSFPAAKSQSDQILSACSQCAQLNVVIKAEGNMDDQELLGISDNIKVFAGAAWTLIHERRQDEGWYDIPQLIK